MSPLCYLILQHNGELQSETVQVIYAARPGVWGVSATPTASAALFVVMVGVMAL